jgi:hypothetical protein
MVQDRFFDIENHEFSINPTPNALIFSLEYKAWPNNWHLPSKMAEALDYVYPCKPVKLYHISKLSV